MEGHYVVGGGERGGGGIFEDPPPRKWRPRGCGGVPRAVGGGSDFGVFALREQGGLGCPPPHVGAHWRWLLPGGGAQSALGYGPAPSS